MTAAETLEVCWLCDSPLLLPGDVFAFGLPGAFCPHCDRGCKPGCERCRLAFGRLRGCSAFKCFREHR